MPHPQRRVSRASTLHRVASGIRRLTFPQDTTLDDWTVFGEAMAHEVAQPAPPPAAAPIFMSTSETGNWTDEPVSDVLHHEAEEEEEEEEEGLGSEEVNIDAASLKDSIRQGSSKPARMRMPTLPTLYRNILKCSIAYFLGSLFTYYPPLSRFIAELTQDGPGEKYPSATGHMVATV